MRRNSANKVVKQPSKKWCLYDILKYIINIMNAIKLPEFKGDPILFHAVSHGNVQEVISLLQYKEANVDARNINGSTPLIYAV